VEFLRLMTFVIPQLSLRDLAAQAPRLFSVLGNCANTGQMEIVSAALEVWKIPEVEEVMKEKPTVAVGIAYPLLSQAQSECWSPAGVSSISEMLRILGRVTPRSRPQEMIADASPASLAAWAKVMRAATTHNGGTDIQEAMMDLQRWFLASRSSVSLKKMNGQGPGPVRAGSQPVTIPKIRVKRNPTPRIVTPF
jgi:hypothetical protein